MRHIPSSPKRLAHSILWEFAYGDVETARILLRCTIDEALNAKKNIRDYLKELGDHSSTQISALATAAGEGPNADAARKQIHKRLAEIDAERQSRRS